MLKSIETRLADIGKKLAPSLSKDALLKLLKQAAALLTEVEQSPSPSTVSAMEACTEALVLPALLRHKDKDVRLLVATCISEIMRIVAPEAPYEDDVLKDIFHLIVAIFEGLNDVSSPSFSRRVNILETVAKVRSCLVMLDLELDDLVLEMFHVFFNTASKDHPQNVFVAMRNILALVLEESEEISQPLLEAVLTNILKDNKDVSPAAHKLAVAVVERSADKLEPYVQKFLTSVMLEGKRAESELQEDYHDIIYEIYCCAPQMLLAVIPNLTQELVTDQIDVRLKAVELLGRLFALPGQHVTQEYRQLFSEFLKRFSDKAVEVRLTVVACAKACLEANPSGPDAVLILAGLDDHLLDYDEKVRMSVVKAICDLVNVNVKWVPIDMVKRVSDRLRDKRVSVRKDTLQKLAEVYRIYTIKCSEGLLPVDEQFEWIPSKIVRCCYDKDFRPQGIEIVFTDDLFSVKLPVEQRAKHWITMFASFDKNDEKAFRNILGQKQRLQLEMQNYLGMRQKSKEEDSPDVQKKIQACFKAIAASFVDSSKAEENLQKLHQMKDNNIFKLLNILLTPSSLFSQTLAARDDLLKRIGEKHPQHDFIKALSTKCSFLLFNKEHVKAVLKEVTTNKKSENKRYVASSLSLLVEFAGFFPVLLEGTEKDLLELFKESDESIKEGVVHVLAKAGGSIRDQISDKESSVDLTLEQLCLEGTRKQAKYAVSAIAAISADSGLKALSVLYGRLVDLLEDKHHLPTILQSLGCIAENAIPVFETREEEVVRFVVRNLLKRESVNKEGWRPDWGCPSEECQLKICGVKSLVKSFLPHKDAQLRTAKLKGLLGVIAKLLTSGEVSDDIQSSDIDKANLRLAAGKAVLRLARRWDQQIPSSIVHSALLLGHDTSIEVRQKFLVKVHQYLKERALHQKYASVFALVAVDTSKEVLTEGKRFLADFVDNSRREARSKQASLSGQIEGTTITLHPEYVLTYLVHILAHQLQFPTEPSSADASAYEPVYRQLLAYLRALLHQDGDGRSDLGKKEDVDNLPAILAIFRTIKNAEDVFDKARSENLYTICDIGIMITKELGKKKHFSGEYPGTVPLPAAFYRGIGTDGGEEGLAAKVDGSHLPACLADNDTLAQFRTVLVNTRTGQPASPWGSKRDRRTLDGDSSSDDEGKDEGEPQSKKTKHTESLDITEGERDATEDATLSPLKQSRGRKKANGDTEKNGVVKVSNKMKKDEEDFGLKPKRGRPRAGGAMALVSGEVSDDSALASHRREDFVEKGKGRKQVIERLPLKNDVGGTLKTANESLKKISGQGLKLAAEGPVKIDEKERSKVSGREKRSAEATRGPSGTIRNPVSKPSIVVPEKSKNQTELQGDGLVGCKIKVWWPLDRRFYKGAVMGYDLKKNKHKVLYDDGEVENLILAHEKWEMVDSTKASKKVESEKPSVASPGVSLSGKLKRKASGQAVDNGNESPEASDKKRASIKFGKDTSSQTLQGVGRGLAQAKSGSLWSPTVKVSKNSASISAGPFAFSDDDVNEPAEERAKQLKSTSRQTTGSVAMSTRIKRNADGKQKEVIVVEKRKEVGEREKQRDLVGGEVLLGKVEVEHMTRVTEKAKGGDEIQNKVMDSDKSKAKGQSQKFRARGNTEMSNPKGNNEKTRDIGKSKVKIEMEKQKSKLERERFEGKDDFEKLKVKEKGNLVGQGEMEKLKVLADTENSEEKGSLRTLQMSMSTTAAAEGELNLETVDTDPDSEKKEGRCGQASVESNKYVVEVTMDECEKDVIESRKDPAGSKNGGDDNEPLSMEAGPGP